MSLGIDTITIEDLGASWRVHFWYRTERDQPRTEFEARFPRDFGELNPDTVEPAMVQLAIEVGRSKGLWE